MARIALAALLALAAFAARAQEIVFDDPVGDDKGPGTYVYPTDRVYKPGSFDITQLKVTQKGDQVTFDLTVNSDLEDPWGMGSGFAVQMAFIHVKTGPGGFTEGLPGTNVAFAPDSAWNKVVILSPQKPFRVKQELKQKTDAKMRDAALVPDTRGKGRVISGTVSKKDLGDGDITTWGYQAILQSNEGFPDKNDVLTRKVNEFEGQHRFGGGNDGDCDPHVVDVLGTPEQQKEMLAYECGPEGASVKKATLKMVRK
jgi:carbohydrate-binding DOMON domain-containing protein